MLVNGNKATDHTQQFSVYTYLRWKLNFSSSVFKEIFETVKQYMYIMIMQHVLVEGLNFIYNMFLLYLFDQTWFQSHSLLFSLCQWDWKRKNGNLILRQNYILLNIQKHTQKLFLLKVRLVKWQSLSRIIML